MMSVLLNVSLSNSTARLFSLALLMLLLGWSCSGRENLYGILEVPRTATTSQIKTAYRKMAKKWHPDRNKSPDAQEKFIQINKAYEVLSDPRKRRRYDMTGETDDQKPQTFHHPDDIFASFRHGPMRRGDSIIAEDFFDRVLPGSHRKLYLLYFHHEFCIQCMAVDQIWNELDQELGPLEVGMGTVSTSIEPKVTRYCGISDVPSIVGVVSGRVIPYRQHFSIRDIKSFLVRILPSHLVKEITDDKSAQDFLSAVFSRNRPRVVLAFRLPSPPPSYLLAAFYMWESLDFAYIPTGSRGGDNINMGDTKVQYGKKQLLVFKEDPVPYLVKNVTSAHMDFHKLRDLVGHMTLYLPRLSSPAKLDAMCSKSWTRLCLILVVEKEDQFNDTVTASYRQLSMSGSHPSHTTLSYMSAPQQSQFLNEFGWSSRTAGKCENGQPARKVLVLKRPPSKTVQYSWLDQYCGGPLPELPATSDTISLRGSGALADIVVDEEGPGLLSRIWLTVEAYCYNALRMVDTQGLYFLFSLLVTGIMICLVTTAAGAQDESDSRKKQRPNVQTRDTGIPKFEKKIYKELKMSQKRLVILIVFAEDKSEAKTTFEKFLEKHNFDKMKISPFHLSYKGDSDFLEALLQSCPDMDQEEVKSRVSGCRNGQVATAVCLVGKKEQLMMYPQETDLVEAFLEEVPKQNESHTKSSSTTGERLGTALGYESDSSSDEEGKNTTTESHSSTNREEDGGVQCPLVDQVKHSFGNWLERLADGSLRRFTISKWPEWT